MRWIIVEILGMRRGAGGCYYRAERALSMCSQNLVMHIAQIMNEFLLQFVDFNNKGLTNAAKYAIIKMQRRRPKNLFISVKSII